MGSSSLKLLTLLHKGYRTLAQGEHDRECVIKIAYAVFERACSLLLNMEVNAGEKAHAKNGQLFECVMGLEYMRNGLNILKQTSSSPHTHRLVGELRPYVDAFSTALLRCLLVDIE